MVSSCRPQRLHAATKMQISGTTQTLQGSNTSSHLLHHVPLTLLSGRCSAQTDQCGVWLQLVRLIEVLSVRNIRSSSLLEEACLDLTAQACTPRAAGPTAAFVLMYSVAQTKSQHAGHPVAESMQPSSSQI